MQQKVPEKQSSHARAAAKLFAGFVARRSANPVADFEALCLAHPAEARAMGVAGRELALAQHRPEQVLREEVASYQRLLVAHGSTPTRNVSCGFW